MSITILTKMLVRLRDGAVLIPQNASVTVT